MADDEGIIGEYLDDHAMGISGDDINQRIPRLQNRNAEIIHENEERRKRIEELRAKTERVEKENMVLQVALAKLLIKLFRLQQESASEKDNDRFLEMCTVELWEESSVLKSPRKGKAAEDDDNNWGSAEDGGGRNNLIGGMNKRDPLVIVGGSFIAAIVVDLCTQAFRKR